MKSTVEWPITTAFLYSNNNQVENLVGKIPILKATIDM